MRWIVSHFAEVLLNNAIERADNLAESGYMLVRDGQLGVLVQRVDGGEIEGIKGAIVEHHSGAVVVDLEAPVIRRVIATSRERPLGDFVCILCELVCLLGGDLRINRDTVGLFREVVGLLRSAVAEYSEQQTGAPSNPTDNHGNQRKIHPASISATRQDNLGRPACHAGEESAEEKREANGLD